jgi:pSer/pThr/pTyr-binding forkhead associated (FHA) protein/tetratricopeptide (TPR) repeat protein
MPKPHHSKAEEISGPNPVPLPDRTRVEPSPFAEAAAAHGDDEGEGVGETSKMQGLPKPPSAESPSIIVNDALDSPGAAPPRRSSTSVRRKVERSNGHSSEADWEAPAPAEDSQATRIGQVPERRLSRVERAMDENATSAGPPISVEVTSGPDRGSRLPIRGGRMIVGRGDGCDLKLTDTSVSRRHLELSVGPSGAILRDLGSGNGTRVNGKREVEIALEHGDEVGLGDTIFKVVDELKRREEEREEHAAAEREELAAAEREELAEREAARPPRVSSASRPAARKGRPPGKREVMAADEAADAEPQASDEGGSTDELERKDPTGVLEVPPSRHLPMRRRAGILGKFDALPKQMRLLIVAGGALLGLILLLVIMSLFRQPQTVQSDTAAKAAQTEAEADRLFLEAQAASRDNRFEVAIKRARESLDLRRTTRAENLVAWCEKAVKQRNAINTAKGFAARGEFDRAIEKAKEILADESDNDDAKSLVKTCTDKKAELVLSNLHKAENDGDFDTARTLMAQMPLEQQEQLRRDITDQEAQWKVTSKKRGAAAAAAAANAKRARLAKQRAELMEVLNPVIRRLDSGDFDGAVRACDHVAESGGAAAAVKARSLKKPIFAFGQAFNDGMSKYNGNNYEQAATSLDRAMKLFKEMDIDDPKLEGQLRERAGQSLAFKGRAAANRQEYGVAARAYKAALALKPDLREALDGLSSIKRNAEEVYNEAYAIRDRDPDAARKRFHDVIDMVPAGDALAKRAQGRIDELDGKSAP